ncbi:MAG: hypothetical protein WCH04_17550, partial [Gammaproteobacteria bacterium]
MKADAISTQMSTMPFITPTPPYSCALCPFLSHHALCISVARLLTPARIGPDVDSGIPAFLAKAAA